MASSRGGRGGGWTRAFPRLILLTGAMAMLLLPSLVDWAQAHPASSPQSPSSGAVSTKMSLPSCSPRTPPITTSTPPTTSSTMYPPGFDIDLRDSDGNTVLHRVAKLEDEAAIRELIHLGADVNVKNKQNSTPLHYAASGATMRCWHKNVTACLSVINLLVEQGAEVNAQDGDGESFLHILLGLVSFLSPEQVHQIALDYGHLFNVRNKWKRTVLQTALGSVKFETATLSLLYKKGVDFQAVDFMEETVLASALSGRQSMPVLYKLIEFGADYTRLSSVDWSLLHLASGHGRADALAFFIEIGGLDINGESVSGHTPLHLVGGFCGKCKLVEVVRLLLENGASKTIKTDAGDTPYDLVLKEGDSLDKEEVLELLRNSNSLGTRATRQGDSVYGLFTPFHLGFRAVAFLFGWVVG